MTWGFREAPDRAFGGPRQFFVYTVLHNGWHELVEK